MLSIRKLPGVKAALSRWPKNVWRVRHVRLMARAISHLCLPPPGRLDQLDNSATDQLYFLKKAKTLGPIFKLIRNGYGYTTCLVGHRHALEFLRAHEEALDGNATDLRGLFPKGHIRAMSAEDHRKYRRLFIQALQATPLAIHQDAIRRWIYDKLAALANNYFGKE